jgi:hypothetical protein
MSQLEARNRQDRARCRPYVRRCCFLVEPFLVLNCFGELPVKIIRQKYITDWYKERLILSGLLLQSPMYEQVNVDSHYYFENGTAACLNNTQVLDHVQVSSNNYRGYCEYVAHVSVKSLT